MRQRALYADGVVARNTSITPLPINYASPADVTAAPVIASVSWPPLALLPAMVARNSVFQRSGLGLLMCRLSV